MVMHFKSLEPLKRITTLVSFAHLHAYMHLGAETAIEGFTCSLGEVGGIYNDAHIPMPFTAILVKHPWVKDTFSQRLQGSTIKLEVLD